MKVTTWQAIFCLRCAAIEALDRDDTKGFEWTSRALAELLRPGAKGPDVRTVRAQLREQRLQVGRAQRRRAARAARAVNFCRQVYA